MSFNAMPIITIIIAVHNGAKTLQQCIDSITQQTYLNTEIIIIDGGSTDGTVNILRNNSDKVNYWVSELDSGIYSAWNKGLVQANGEWLCFLGADDYFYNERVLEEICAELANLPARARVAYGQVMLIDVLGVPIFAVGESWQKAGKLFTKLMSIPHPGTMHHKSLFDEYGGFDDSFKIAGDYEFLLRELKAAPAHFMPNLTTVCMQVGGISSNPSNTIKQLKEVRKAQKKHGDYWPSLTWLMAYLRPCIRIALFKTIGEKSARSILDYFRSLSGKAAYWTKTR
jgi:glycosyltransferase involved in cell wall biosynthesis